MKRITKFWRHIIAIGLLFSTFSTFYASHQFEALKLLFNYWDPIAISEYRLKLLSTEEFKSAIEQSLTEGDVDDAQEMVTLAEKYGHKLPEELIEQTQENVIEYSVRYTSDFIEGAVYGQVSSGPSLFGAMAADFFLVGDLRDVSIQGANLVTGKEYDSVTLGMSLIGLASAAPRLTPATPVASSVQAGASLIKTANKVRKLTKPLVD